MLDILRAREIVMAIELMRFAYGNRRVGAQCVQQAMRSSTQIDKGVEVRFVDCLARTVKPSRVAAMLFGGGF